jgi:hypothetical protein
MASQIMANNNNNISPSDPSHAKPEEHDVRRNQACKLYGDIGHSLRIARNNAIVVGEIIVMGTTTCRRLHVFCVKE